VLRDGDERRLVVRRRVDGGDLVRAGRQAAGDLDGELAVDGRVVEALEERELGRVRRRRLAERGELLDDDVRVADDLALAVDLLRRAEVVLLCVNERAWDAIIRQLQLVGQTRIRKHTRLQVLDRELDGERRVRLDRLVAVRGEDELARGHDRLRRDLAHRRRVARAGGDLLAVRDRLAGAEVDKVVRRRERRDLARLGHVLPVVRKAGGNHGRVERGRGLDVAVVVVAARRRLRGRQRRLTSA
jgi:hypothetical protein